MLCIIFSYIFTLINKQIDVFINCMFPLNHYYKNHVVSKAKCLFCILSDKREECLGQGIQEYTL